jgi:hypothetical protein
MYPDEFMNIYVDFYRRMCKRWGIRRIDTGKWHTYIDGRGEVRPFISDCSIDCKQRIATIDLGADGDPTEFYEAAEMSDRDLRQLCDELAEMNERPMIVQTDEF